MRPGKPGAATEPAVLLQLGGAAASCAESRPGLGTQASRRHLRQAPRASVCMQSGTQQEGTARTWYPGMDLTASTTARDIRCWTNGILCPSRDLSGMQTSSVERAHPMGLSHAFLPRPGRQAPRPRERTQMHTVPGSDSEPQAEDMSPRNKPGR